MKICVSSYGAVTPAGIGSEILFDSVFSGKSMISKLPNDICVGLASKIGGICNIDENDPFVSECFQNKNDLRRMDKFLILVMLAFAEAKKKIRLKEIIQNSLIDKKRIGVIIGCGIGGLSLLERAFGNLSFIDEENDKTKKPSPFMIPYGITNMSASLIGMDCGAEGLTLAVSSACASATHATCLGYDMLKNNQYDMVIVGGTEAAVTRLGVGGFDSMFALSRKYNQEPEKASRPFDKDRDGFVISEGAGVLILEREDSLKKRGGESIAEIAGSSYGSLVTHITSPDEEGRGAYDSMKACLNEAKIKENDIGVINMHATSTSVGDEIEAKAINRLFGLDNQPILSATKSITGHSLGAVGAIEAILLIETLKRRTVPSNINLDEVDNFALDMNISKKSQTIENNKLFGISNSFGFGGTNASIIIKA